MRCAGSGGRGGGEEKRGPLERLRHAWACALLIPPAFPRHGRAQVIQTARTSRWIDEETYNPSYNAAPGATRSPVVRVSESGQREIRTMRWVSGGRGGACRLDGQAGARSTCMTDTYLHVGMGLQPQYAVLAWMGGGGRGRPYPASPSPCMPSLCAVPRQTRWGLVPSYTKPDETPDFWRMFNARSETAAERPAFQRLLQRRRCLVLVAGFYEWRKEGKAGKQPYYMHMKGDAPLVMAGLWDTWASAGEGLMHTYTILTTGACRPGSGSLLVGVPGSAWVHRRREVNSFEMQVLSHGATPGIYNPTTPRTGEGTGAWRPHTPSPGPPHLMQTRARGWGGCTTACPCCCRRSMARTTG